MHIYARDKSPSNTFFIIELTPYFDAPCELSNYSNESLVVQKWPQKSPISFIEALLIFVRQVIDRTYLQL